MAGFSLLGLGAALGIGYLAGRKKKSNTPQGIAPPPTAAPAKAASSVAEKVAATAPPDPIKAASDNMAAATTSMQRTRKRAGAGTAGKVSTGPVSNAQKAVTNSGQARSLLGY